MLTQASSQARGCSASNGTSKLIKFSVLHGNANLDQAIGPAAAPSHLLTLAHKTPDHTIDRRLDKARRDAPALLLVSPAVDQRLDVGLEVLQRIGQALSRLTRALCQARFVQGLADFQQFVQPLPGGLPHRTLGGEPSIGHPASFLSRGEGLITMAMIGKVKRMYFREKKSVREIVRLTSLSRNTVRKWLRRLC